MDPEEAAFCEEEGIEAVGEVLEAGWRKLDSLAAGGDLWAESNTKNNGSIVQITE